MARRSNKTEHVLKLITKNEDVGANDFFTEQDTEKGKKQDIDEGTKQDTDEDIKTETNAAADIKPDTNTDAEAGIKKDTSTDINPVTSIDKIKDTKYEPALKKYEVTADIQQSGNYNACLKQNNNLINLAEILTREKLGLVMGKMNVCTCPTCTNDVLALALNSLPAKYVTDEAKLESQLKIYKEKHEMDMLAALAKSCVRVKAIPRHNVG
ncbi:MAG: late competence development ComFB family protein [Eubacteriales bacterium]|nr:late competence development ComFB family protein [Eubacteriales bacterium]MDD3199273.1 late competence development ComFB family protein [Eubacteriales bacterium]MDD4122060.1 late competence development ComFB family protein [Eubacteriales bacterium]MDD4629403.1 late competence development ComFB family protein [Eubacteriales bacterium]